MIRETGAGLREILTTHHKLMADVALLLRTIQKIEDFDFPQLNLFMQRYKEFIEQLNCILKTVLSEDMARYG